MRGSRLTRLSYRAFSRSPQLWSSYTSLLRDVVHTCWATRSWHDSSAIRDLYRNISQNQHEHLRKVLLYEQHRYESYAKEAERREGWQNEADATVGNLKANAKVSVPLRQVGLC